MGGWTRQDEGWSLGSSPARNGPWSGPPPAQGPEPGADGAVEGGGGGPRPPPPPPPPPPHPSSAGGGRQAADDRRECPARQPGACPLGVRSRRKRRRAKPAGHGPPAEPMRTDAAAAARGVGVAGDFSAGPAGPQLDHLPPRLGLTHCVGGRACHAPRDQALASGAAPAHRLGFCGPIGSRMSESDGLGTGPAARTGPTTA